MVITHAKGWDDKKRPVQACTFGMACRRKDCYFTHPRGWDPLNPVSAEAGAGAASGAAEGSDDEDRDEIGRCRLNR